MNAKGQAKLYYLYMMADGEVSNSENKLFDKICKELNLDEEDKKCIKQECNILSRLDKMNCIEVVKKNVEESDAIIDSQYMFFEPTGIRLRRLDIDLYGIISNADKAKIIWNLVNLGYADLHFTIDEREVVDYLRAHWKFPDSIYQEMIDVAETCVALEKYRGWIEGLPDTDYKSKKIMQVKKDIDYVQEMILTTISEKSF